MANEKSKQKLNIWLEKSLVAQIDGVCARDDLSRATVIKNALNMYFENNSKDLQIQAINSRLSAIEQQNQAQTALLLDAIQNQPVAVQQLEQPKQRKFLKFLKQKKD